jgi:glycosyltransferase involved in cell wall biosynthesis
VKILIAHNYYRQPGGEDQVFASEAKLLEDHGHEVIRYSVRNSDAAEYGAAQMAATAIWNHRSYTQLRDLIRKERPGVAHIHNTFHLMSPSVLHAAKAEGVPVVQTLHNYRLLCANATLLRDGRVCEDCLGKRVPWPAVRHGCYRGSRVASLGAVLSIASHRLIGTWARCTDVVIAPSDFQRRKLIEGGLPGAKIVVKPNFICPDPGLRPGNGGYAVFVGRLAPEKGIETLLEAWKTLGREIPLRILGDGPQADLVARAARELPGVTWLGHQGREQVHEIVGRANCLIVPSAWYEVLPLVVLEAFASGTPLVVSHLGAPAELVKGSKVGLCFAPGDAADLVRQVRRMFDGSLDVAGMRARARTEFEAKYSAAVNYEMLLAVYRTARTTAVSEMPSQSIDGVQVDDARRV